jgi:magnesium chelatase family protein
MYSCINSGSPLGIDGLLVSVEADISSGLPSLSMVGYLSSSVREAGDRVRTALRNSGYGLPPRRITVSLSPADVRKDGAGYDLAIAVALLCCMEVLPREGLDEYLFLGELGLDGSVREIPGVLAVAHFAAKQGYRKLVVPKGNAAEAACIDGIRVYGVESLLEVVSFLEGELILDPTPRDMTRTVQQEAAHDISEIHGQKAMKRGVEIAVAGFHNILFTGAAGAGKSLMAKCLPGLMPEMTYEEQLELTKIYSVAGLLRGQGGLMHLRPFRSPHANVSAAALLGGGPIPKPGEVSLADCGVLFLDEFPEFGRGVIESLRAPMEDQEVTVSRVRASYRFPARFMLVAARNNCPCGFYPDRSRCRCTERQILDYRNRISHPIMDRIDIRIEVRPVKAEDLLSKVKEEDSASVRTRIERARERQLQRYRGEGFCFNSTVPQTRLQEYIRLGKEEEKLLQAIYEKGDLSARGYFKVLRLARTIADLAGRDQVNRDDLTEALFFRNVGLSEEEGGGV